MAGHGLQADIEVELAVAAWPVVQGRNHPDLLSSSRPP